MKETMTCYERLEAAWNLEEADRVPVAPLVIYLLPYQSGLQFKEMIEDPEKLVQSAIDNSDLIGDCLHPVLTLHDHQALLPHSTWDRVTLDWRIFDKFPPEGNIPSAYFDKVMIEDYDDVMERGFSTLMFNKQISSDVFERSIDDFLYYGFEYSNDFFKAWQRFYEETGKTLVMGSRSIIPLDHVMAYRTFEKIAMDMMEQPEKIKEMCKKVAEWEIMRAMEKCMVAGAGKIPGAEKIFLGIGTGAPPYISPRTFDEFSYPTIKMMVDMAVNRGFKVHLHADGDLTQCLHTLKGITDGLPKGMVMIDFEKTDMKKAKEVLGDTVCIYGNVPSSLFVYGTPEETDDYCRQLIEDCAPGGGFVLGSECEVPWDAKPDNVRAMIKSVEKYGRY
ncbi:MAG: hypothetical protein JRH15_10820 [Deltaproteobacteria bacterium]|nr:hypothetical protein [Deltaproteobacteria bacterium]